MQMCKDTSSGTDAFIRSVEAAPEPMCASYQSAACWSWKLLYCTSFMSINLLIPPSTWDPSMSLPLPIIIIWLKLAEENHPVILGPILIHQTKKFQPFHYFASTLIRLNPRLVNLKVFGTDEEPQLMPLMCVFLLQFTCSVRFTYVRMWRTSFAILVSLRVWKDSFLTISLANRQSPWSRPSWFRIRNYV